MFMGDFWDQFGDILVVCQENGCKIKSYGVPSRAEITFRKNNLGHSMKI